MNLRHDITLNIATGKSRKDTAWKNRSLLWSALLDRIKDTHRTAETYAEYITAKKDRQDEIKDIGGFVGGYLTAGRRKTGHVSERQLVTLDIDNGYAGFWEDFLMIYEGTAAALYSTHKHCSEQPRYRLLLPLDREVKADEYEAIGRRIAGNLGMKFFDDTTFEPARLMYWPSTSKDGQYVFEYQDGPALVADEILGTYRNWQDMSEWPVSPRQNDRMKARAKKQGHPHEKPGIVGAFCRTYDVQEAISEYLSDVYEECAGGDRYTYTPGSCSGGLVIYDDGLFAFSNHSTDPASGKLCNSFDLVRLHLYGLQDENCSPDTPINKRPSYLRMEETARKDKVVKLRLSRERIEDAKAEFADGYTAQATPVDEGAEVSDDWLAELEKDKKGSTLSTLANINLILENDSSLKRVFAYDDFTQRRIITRSLPWRSIDTGRHVTDGDDANLSYYFEKFYGIPLNVTKQEKAVSIIFDRYRVHPVRDYLGALHWDGEPRADGVFIDYLGALDSPYTRAVTRKILTAAVARVFAPGIKFDYALVLVGRQGVGKSTIIQRLGRQWFSDTFNTVEGKEAYEQLHGVWLLEMGELAGLRKAEVGTIKHFISKTVDRYRVAYGTNVTDFPRQCVFFGTTNNADFLRNDANGNRKFWPVPVFEQAPRLDVWEDLADDIVGQIWAEAVQLFRGGESLHLSPDLEADAGQVQIDHTEQDERTGPIAEFLDMLLPHEWEDWDIDQRRGHLTAGELQAVGKQPRAYVCSAEIWCELYGRRLADMTAYNTKDIHAVMRNMAGWELVKKVRRFKNYGPQRWYRRVTPF